MTTIFDAPEEFASTALAGFASIYNRYVRHVRGGGVVRSTKVPQGKVAVVVGGAAPAITRRLPDMWDRV
ncbi:hypothetical protein Q644_17675 [Brucella intermedia 229E]|uniref:Uncharacterized protein n=1 Tax=Brucella intermedia 229E TaxID=1337887 RepID=U4VB52_9HYPH|nr:hypothetical protein Q644_17675 [Brucella intermedia 229E]